MGDQEGREYVTPEIEKRQHRRAKLVTQVRCEVLGREELLVTRDVSIGGLFVKTPTPLPLDSEVSVSFRLGATDSLLSCRAKVAYSIKSLGMGLLFVGLSEESRSALQKFVDESD